MPRSCVCCKRSSRQAPLLTALEEASQEGRREEEAAEKAVVEEEAEEECKEAMGVKAVASRRRLFAACSWLLRPLTPRVDLLKQLQCEGDG